MNKASEISVWNSVQFLPIVFLHRKMLHFVAQFAEHPQKRPDYYFFAISYVPPVKQYFHDLPNITKFVDGPPPARYSAIVFVLPETIA